MELSLSKNGMEFFGLKNVRSKRMKPIRKVFSILLVLCMMLGAFAIKPVPTKAIQKFWMELSSPRAGANCEYKFHFSIEKKLQVHQYIKLVLPPGTRIIKTPSPASCVAEWTPDIYTLADGSVEIKYNSHIELDPEIEGYRDIVVKIPAKTVVADVDRKYYSLEFFNPPNPGLYTYKIATQAEPTLVTSKPVSILDYPLPSPIVQIEPNQPKEKAGYSLDLDLNKFCDLKAGQDTINIQFPGEVTFNKVAQDIHRDWITVNESNLLFLPMVRDNLLIIPIPNDLKPGQHVSIKIDSRVGLTNPEKAGMYELNVRLSNQFNWFRSFPYYIAIQPSPVLLKIEPTTPREVAEFSILHHQERLELKPLDKIYVRFPSEMRLPTTIPGTEVLINNQPAFRVKVEGQVVEIALKSRAKGWMPLEIKLTKYSKIKIPVNKKMIQLELKLKEDAEFIPTNPVEIT
jgi:hypothetical protein